MHHMSIYVRVDPFEKSVFGKGLAKHGIHSSQYWDSGVQGRKYGIKGSLVDDIQRKIELGGR